MMELCFLFEAVNWLVASQVILAKGRTIMLWIRVSDPLGTDLAISSGF